MENLDDDDHHHQADELAEKAADAVMIKKHARPTVVLDEMRKLQAVNYQPEILTERPSAENLTNWNVRHEIISIAP